MLPTGTDISQQPIDLRDNYTSLVWLGGTIALDRTNQPGSAVAMFYNYARGGHSLQVQTKGNYWAGRAALAAGRFQEANDYFQRAAAYPELFYGQLALERLGKSVSLPAPSASAIRDDRGSAGGVQRQALVQAVRLLGQQGRSAEEALFIRALADPSTTTPSAILPSNSGSRSIGRTCPSGSHAWRGSRVPRFTFGRPIRRFLHRCRPNCGRSPTASAARKALSIRTQSAMPARAA